MLATCRPLILNMALANASKSLSSLVLGTCLPSLKHNASKFKIQYLYFDQSLKAYFRKSFVIFAYDPQKICKAGDVVLIQELKKGISTSITHEVLEIVYPCGDVTDPITGKKAVASEFRDDIEFKNSLFGKGKSNFDYKKAPTRGWQEGRKDFTHRQTYRKYNEFDEGDEHKNQPDSTLL